MCKVGRIFLLLEKPEVELTSSDVHYEVSDYSLYLSEPRKVRIIISVYKYDIYKMLAQ